MALKFFVTGVGAYICYGLSTDTKPATPPADCLFIEIDTGKQFRAVASAWVSLLEPTAIGAAAPYVILSVGTLTNGVHDQLVTGNVGHVGTETDTFTFVSGSDIAGSTVLGTTNTPLSPVGDAHILYTNINALTPTFSYPAGAVDLATDVNSPDGVGVFKTGVYKITGACNIGAAGITLTGLGTFIFIITGALDSTAASIINLANGATADNVFFVSGGAVTLAAGTTFVGTILSGPNAITTGANFNLSGRLISETTINLGGGTNTFTVPLFTPSGSAAWGDITGTLANQTDLQAALGAKVDEVAGVFSGASGSFLNTGLNIESLDALFNLILRANETLTANRTLSILLNNANRSLTISGDATLSGSHTGTSSGANTGDQTLPTRASLGLDTTDSPQFTGINLGHATDTTITRVSAGVIAVEGVNLMLSTAFSGLSKITVGTVAPSTPAVGDLWCDTN